MKGINLKGNIISNVVILLSPETEHSTLGGISPSPHFSHSCSPIYIPIETRRQSCGAGRMGENR